MRDTVITARRKKVEFATLFICFIVANIVNAYSIVKFNTLWKEMLTSLGFVVAATFVLYLLWTALRIVFYLFKRLFVRKKRRRR